MAGLQINMTLLNTLMTSVQEGLKMTGIDPIPVGASRLLNSSRSISAVVGLIGNSCSGAMTLNLGETTACFLAGKLICEEVKEVDTDCLDAVCELSNMIAGRLKFGLSETEFRLDAISCPSVIMGPQYAMHVIRGFHTAAVEFEIEDLPISHMENRFFSVSLSVMRK